MPRRLASNKEARKRKTTAICGKDPNKRTKITKDSSRPNMALTSPKPKGETISDSQPQTSPTEVLMQEQFQPSPPLAHLHSPNVRPSTPISSSTIQYRQPVLTGFPIMSTPADIREAMYRISRGPMHGFQPILRPILDEAKRQMRDWTLFVNPLPEPNVLMLQSSAVVEYSRRSIIGLFVITTPTVDDREYLSSRSLDCVTSLHHSTNPE